MSIKGSIRRIKKRFVAGFGLNAVVGAVLLTGLIALASNFPGDESEAIAQNVPPEHGSVLLSR